MKKKRIYLSEVFPPAAISKAIAICLSEKYLERENEGKADVKAHTIALQNGKISYYFAYQIEKSNSLN